MEDDVDVWHYAILQLHARNDDDDELQEREGGGVEMGGNRTFLLVIFPSPRKSLFRTIPCPFYMM